MPKLLSLLRNRKVYFFTNEYQDLSFFSDFGIEVDEARVVKVPFRNSYLLYDEYVNYSFPEGAVVLLMCGMLAKILVKDWVKVMNNVTFLALGSSLDDLIQKEKINYKPFPISLPFTSNRTRSGKTPVFYLVRNKSVKSVFLLDS